MGKNVNLDLIKILIVEIAKSFGFESINSKALECISEYFVLKMDMTLSNFTGKINHSKRNYLNLFDLVKFNNAKSGGNKFMLNFINYSQISNIINNDDKLEYEQYPDVEEWVSPLENRKERLIHIYDWMPELPPTYTYRQTPLLESLNRSEAIKAKTKMDQSLKSEKNMFKLFKASNSIPPFINYLHQSKK